MKKYSLNTYIVGYGLTVLLTIGAFALVAQQSLSKRNLVAVVISLAVIQLFVQLRFFLHLGKESKPRWNLAAFAFMAVVLVILVFGSLWIMYSLNYSHEDDDVSPAETERYILEDEGIRRLYVEKILPANQTGNRLCQCPNRLSWFFSGFQRQCQNWAVYRHVSGHIFNCVIGLCF